MLNRIVLRRGARHEAEGPFWISFSDLMSALMVLFLVVMAVTLVSVTRDVGTAEQPKIQRSRDIRELMSRLRETTRAFPDVKVDESTYRIDLGDVVRFDRNRAELSLAGARLLRAYVPTLLDAQRSELGQRWIRRIVVEGFTDHDGTYLYNLGLSLKRSRRVVCALYAPPLTGEQPLTDAQKRQIRDLFLVGGYAFNASRPSKEASRRVELKLEFWSADELRDGNGNGDGDGGSGGAADARAFGAC